MGAILKLVSSFPQKVKGAQKDVALEQHLCIQASFATPRRQSQMVKSKMHHVLRVVLPLPSQSCTRCLVSLGEIQRRCSHNRPLDTKKNVWSCGTPRKSANGGETGKFWSVEEVCRKGAGEQICAFDLSACTATAEPHSPNGLWI